MWNYNGKVIKEGRAWADDNGTQHPANWQVWSADEKTSKGLVWTDPVTPPDSRFYRWHQNADGTISSTPRPLDDVPQVDENGDPIMDPTTGKQMVTLGLKSQAVEQTKQTQGSLLSQTDWAYIRKQDTGIVVPEDIQTYRDSVRTQSMAIEDQIRMCSTLDAFKALYDTPVDAAGNATGNPPINDWPETV